MPAPFTLPSPCQHLRHARLGCNVDRYSHLACLLASAPSTTACCRSCGFPSTICACYAARLCTSRMWRAAQKPHSSVASYHVATCLSESTVLGARRQGLFSVSPVSLPSTLPLPSVHIPVCPSLPLARPPACPTYIPTSLLPACLPPSFQVSSHPPLATVSPPPLTFVFAPPRGVSPSLEFLTRIRCLSVQLAVPTEVHHSAPLPAPHSQVVWSHKTSG